MRGFTDTIMVPSLDPVFPGLGVLSQKLFIFSTVDIWGGQMGYRSLIQQVQVLYSTIFLQLGLHVDLLSALCHKVSPSSAFKPSRRPLEASAGIRYHP